MFKNMLIKKLNYIPLEGTLTELPDGFYADIEGNLWEVFEGIWMK